MGSNGRQCPAVCQHMAAWSLSLNRDPGGVWSREGELQMELLGMGGVNLSPVLIWFIKVTPVQPDSAGL